MFDDPHGIKEQENENEDKEMINPYAEMVSQFNPRHTILLLLFLLGI